MRKLLSNAAALENSALNGMCYFTVDNELLNFRNFFKKLRQNKLDVALDKALAKVIALIEAKWADIVLFINSIPSYEDNIKIISDVQKEFFIKTMDIRFKKLIKQI